MKHIIINTPDGTITGKVEGATIEEALEKFEGKWTLQERDNNGVIAVHESGNVAGCVCGSTYNRLQIGQDF